MGLEWGALSEYYELIISFYLHTFSGDATFAIGLMRTVKYFIIKFAKHVVSLQHSIDLQRSYKLCFYCQSLATNADWIHRPSF